MSIPINPGNMQGGAARGRRNPALMRELAQGGAPPGAVRPQPQQLPPPDQLPPAADQQLPPPGLTDGLVAVPAPGVEPEAGYPVGDEDMGVWMFPGDVIRGRLTLAIDFGTGGTSFLYWEHGTIAREGETDEDTYQRVAGEVIDKVFRLADDVDDRLARREADRVAAAQAAGIG